MFNVDVLRGFISPLQEHGIEEYNASCLLVKHISAKHVRHLLQIVAGVRWHQACLRRVLSDKVEYLEACSIRIEL
ncbi:hypothetical protein TIFTF001_024396 [Ficus carica]|uniref:Uncharacterized protein n=1 Tax=Ficus carica TaxID=3494 RepID=A0AA88ANA5_FICCA|nr:hypothetical protein TIFTF001_024396 [Ficus carica]